jgi:hypothetical protein
LSNISPLWINLCDEGTKENHSGGGNVLPTIQFQVYRKFSWVIIEKIGLFKQLGNLSIELKYNIREVLSL